MSFKTSLQHIKSAYKIVFTDVMTFGNLGKCLEKKSKRKSIATVVVDIPKGEWFVVINDTVLELNNLPKQELNIY